MDAGEQRLAKRQASKPSWFTPIIRPGNTGIATDPTRSG
jgi:hypothetical protein